MMNGPALDDSVTGCSFEAFGVLLSSTAMGRPASSFRWAVHGSLRTWIRARAPIDVSLKWIYLACADE